MAALVISIIILDGSTGYHYNILDGSTGYYYNILDGSTGYHYNILDGSTGYLNTIKLAMCVCVYHMC